jgi:hypothetical protein
MGRPVRQCGHTGRQRKSAWRDILFLFFAFFVHFAAIPDLLLAISEALWKFVLIKKFCW